MIRSHDALSFSVTCGQRKEEVKHPLQDQNNQRDQHEL